MENLPQKKNEQLGLTLNTMEDMLSFSDRYCKSGLAIKGDTPQKVFIKLQMGAEFGMRAMQSLNEIVVINNRPSLYTATMKALVLATGLLEKCTVSIENFTDPNNKTTVRAVCVIKRKGLDEQTYTFSMEDARQAGLSDSNVWTKYPKVMLRWRVQSMAFREQFPDVTKGLHTYEELVDAPPLNDERGPVELKPEEVTITDVSETYSDGTKIGVDYAYESPGDITDELVDLGPDGMTKEEQRILEAQRHTDPLTRQGPPPEMIEGETRLVRDGEEASPEMFSEEIKKPPAPSAESSERHLYDVELVRLSGVGKSPTPGMALTFFEKDIKWDKMLAEDKGFLELKIKRMKEKITE